MRLQEYFDKLKLELHLLGLESDEYFEQIGGRPVNVSVSGGEHNLKVTFGFPGDRRGYTGITPEKLALEIYSYLQRKAAYERGSTVGKAYGDVKPPAARPKPKVTVPKVPQAPKTQPKKAEPPPRRVFNLGPGSLYENAKRDTELQFEDFHNNVMVITKTGEIKEAMSLRLSDLSPEHIAKIQEYLRGLERLNRELDNWHS